MPRYWVPRFIEYVPELPRTESHKVKKVDLRDAGVTPQTWDRERDQVQARVPELSTSRAKSGRVAIVDSRLLELNSLQ